MKKKRHLRLVISHNSNYREKNKYLKFLVKIKDSIESFFISKNEKIYILKDILIQIYKEYETTTGINDIPYFVKAEKRICKIIKDKKVNYYFKRLKKFRNHNFY